jgi:hypothetical protein
MITTAVSSASGLTRGTPSIKSVGAITFSPEGILFVADNATASIFALDVGDTAATGDTSPVDVEDLDTRLAAYLGCSREDVFIKDMAVHPQSHRVYLSVMRGSGNDALPVIIAVDSHGTLTDVPLRDIPFAQAAVTDAPAEDDARQDGRLVQGSREGAIMEPRPGWKLRVAFDKLRTVTVTDMACIDGVLYVAGASNEEFSSTLRRIPFPFNGQTASSSLEIFHVSHAKYETASPIRSLVPYQGGDSVLASYTCTPVVRFSLADLAPGAQVKGRTVAELGAGNTPLDMVAYTSGGEEFLLVSNVRHPLMKLKSRDIEVQAPLTEPHEPVGVPRDTLPQQGVSRMANLNNQFIVMLQMDEAEHYGLRSYGTADL